MSDRVVRGYTGAVAPGEAFTSDIITELEAAACADLLVAAKAVRDWIVDWHTVRGVIPDSDLEEVATLTPAYDALCAAIEQADD